ncbi:MAG: MBL fold metallo-hydrolase [Clostridiales Family XIII bacterium]|jgi:metallo-beta-lactamase family protein|nr:MBL fold metallo-hydrolase [Clostridiales Family XIII bacterium]
MKIKFCGAATSVTGSCHLITTDKYKFLLDCGQFQGSSAEDRQNFDHFPFDPSEVDFLVLSHAHIDHCGRIPLLVKRGFEGPIYCTEATSDLLPVMLLDSAHIHEKEAEWKNRKAARSGNPFVEPLFTIKDAERSLRDINAVLYDQLLEPVPGVRIVFNDAGHILGSAIIEVFVEEDVDASKSYSKLVFTGDLGVAGRPILRNPTYIKKADYLVMESTYGDRLHEEGEMSIRKLTDIIQTTIARRGNVVIPSFAVGRTQELIFDLGRAMRDDKALAAALKDVNFYVDSPMAIAATEVFADNAQDFDDAAKDIILHGDNPFDLVNLVFTQTTEESKAINEDTQPKVIISASGMCEAGRIRHHLKHNLWKPENSIVFVGYQGVGTLGRRLLEGEENVVLFGEVISVNAEIHNLEGFSAHADKEGLMDFVRHFEKLPSQIFLVHGEASAKNALAYSIEQERGAAPIVVTEISEYDLERGQLGVSENPWKGLADSEDIEKLRSKLSTIHTQIEEVLYKAYLNLGTDKNEEHVAKLEGLVTSLEKDTIDIAGVINETKSN